MDPNDLLLLIESYLQNSGLSETAFGVEALRDPNFVRDLRAGREPRRRTVERALSFMQSIAA